MSGVGVELLSHVARRGLEQYSAGENAMATSMPAEAKIELSNFTIFGVGAITLLTLLIVLSVDYTVGSLMATLSMIESPSTTTIVESAPPAYTDKADGSLEKKEYEAAGDVEVVVINHKPITARVVTTIKHLHSIGGFTARWRGLFQNVIYHMAINFMGHGIERLLFSTVGPVGGMVIGRTFALLACCRLRMLWTHAMIAMPTTTRWYNRFVPRKQSRALLLPTLVLAVSQQLTMQVPVVVARIVNISRFFGPDGAATLSELSGWEAGMVMFSALAIPASAVAVALSLYLPACITLTRIEACLLPEDQETIVPFDREAIMGEIDLTQRCASKKLFVATWKSVDGAVRHRIVKLYVKLTAFQIFAVFVGLQLDVAFLYLTCKDQMVNAFKIFVM